MRSAEQIKEKRLWCDPCRVNSALGIRKPHNCPSCGNPVNNFNDPDREKKIEIMIEQRRQQMQREAEEQEKNRARIEAELESGEGGEDGSTQR
jgi:hypothetical protein